MVKKKEIVSKLVLGLFVLTALSFCFLGSTFARFTSGGNGSATADIAKWDVSFGQEEESEPVSLGMISPLMNPYAEGTVRSHTGEKLKIATITNNSDVKASVTIDLKDFVLNLVDAESVPFGEKTWTASSEVEGLAPTEAQAESLFSIKLWYCGEDTDTDDPSKATSVIEAGKSAITLDAKGGDSSVLNIFAEITWTSLDEKLQKNSDALDTWVGKNVEGMNVSFVFTAVQASEKPGV